MKRFLVLLLLAVTLLNLCACVPQKTVDEMTAQYEDEKDSLEEELAETEADLTSLQNQLNKTKNQLKETETSLASAEDRIAELEADLEQAQTTAEKTQSALNDALAQVDELKNGPDRALAAVRTAYDAADWKQVISLAAALHSKFPGMDQDLEAQKLAAAAQKTLDDEAAKAAAEAAKTLEDKVHGLIRITKLTCSKPNSADGVGIYLYFKNMHPEKTIKYLNVTVCPYNAVGDMLDCDIRGYSRYTCEATGPFAPGKGLTSSDNWWWPNAWYNSTIKSIKLVALSIEYTDGTSVTLTKDELAYAIW